MKFRQLRSRRRAAREADLDRELQDHLDLEAEDQRESGLSPEGAAYAARRAFGNTMQVKEEVRMAWGLQWLETLLQDLSYGLRQLRRNPGFAAVAVITLALGIGANTAIFSLIDAVMLSSMPVRDPSQLVLLRWKAHQSPHHVGSSSFGDCPGSSSSASASGCVFPIPVFQKMQSETKVFSSVIAFAGPLQFNLSGNGPPTMANGELVSGNYFSTLGVKPALGRVIGPEDDKPQASPVVVLSYAYWQSAFGGARSAVGRSIVLNNVPFTIVGVAAPSFTHLSPGKMQDFWLPIAIEPRLGVKWIGKDLQNVRNWWVVLLARLKPGVSRAQAQAATSLIFHNEVLHAAGKPMFKPQDDPAITLLPAPQGLTGIRGHYSKPLYLLMFAVSFILLIACANVAGLLLARGAARQREMAVRLAVGAGRVRIMRQLLTESVMLSVAGGLLGVLLAYWGVHVLTALLWGHSNHSVVFVVAPDWRVLAFTIAISLLTGIFFGLAPALRSSRVDLTPALKENMAPDGGTRVRWFHFRDALVVAQVGLSVVLLAGAGLLVRTLVNLRDINPGFDTQNLLLFGIDPTSLGYKDPQIRSLYQELRARLAALPGVVSVSYSSDEVLSGGWWSEDVHIEGHPGKSTVDMVSPGPDFFRTLHIPLLEGRIFNSSDFEQAAEAAAAEKAAKPTGKSSPPRHGPTQRKPAGPPVPVLVNPAFVRKYFAHQNPLGKRLGNDKSKPRAWEIVGVVGNVKIINLRHRIHPTVYIPLTGGSAYFELRIAGNPRALIPTVRKLESRVDSRLPIFDVHTQTQKIDDLLSNERFIARVSSFFGLLALLLACVGLYGLLAYEVSRRIREIGIRMALGAQRTDVLRLVLRQGLKLTVVGLACGGAGALAFTRFLSSQLYGVKPTDPLTFVAVSVILTSVALLACYIPARRAAKVDPMVALRYE
jgi:macrolide transport system ATP-binding/permease protein